MVGFSNCIITCFARYVSYLLGIPTVHVFQVINEAIQSANSQQQQQDSGNSDASNKSVLVPEAQLESLTVKS